MVLTPNLEATKDVARSQTSGSIADGSLRIAVILPCLNEASAIAGVIEEFQRALPDAQCYVIDNGSTDDTAGVAERAGAIVLAEERRGKGNAVRRAFAAIDADIFVMADGDGTYDASRAPELIEILRRERLDMVVGARRKASDEAYRRGHEFGNRLFNWTLHTFFGSEFKDIFSGYRIFSRRYVRAFPAFSDGFEIETEMSIHSLLLRMPVREVDTDYGKRAGDSQSKLKTFRDGLRIMRTIFNMMRHYRPLRFYSAVALLFAILSAILFLPILLEYFDTGLVPRMPTLMVAVGMAVVSVLFFISGLILATTVRTQLELRRLIYMSTPRQLTDEERLRSG